MSQAIQSFTPQVPSYPYQGNLQQQVSAALASSSSGMPGDSIAPIVVGMVAGCGLLTLGVILAVNHSSTSSDKPKLAQATSQKSVERAHTPQLESVPTSIKETRQRQSVSPPSPPLPQLASSPRPQSESRQTKVLSRFVDNFGVYRERQIRGLCCMHALNTVLHLFFGEDKIITQEEFEDRVPEEGARMEHVKHFAEKNGLYIKIHDAVKFGESGITSIEDAKAFIIFEPRSSGFHYVAMVRPEAGKGFHLSDSWDQENRKIYPGTATEALLEYQRKNNTIARAVITFHERAPAQGIVPQRPSSPLR